MVYAYDEDAEATGWLGPEVAFGLLYKYIQPGQSVLDIGIGTGLGSVLFRKAGLNVYGMDISTDMLEACRIKGFTHLARHDLRDPPYPYTSASLDYAVCVGVFNFFSDLSPIFLETERILRTGGMFVFAAGDRTEAEPMEVVVGTEHTNSGIPVTMYRHSARQIKRWLVEFGFTLLRSLSFTVYMDCEKTRSLQERAYLVKKTGNIDGDSGIQKTGAIAGGCNLTSFFDFLNFCDRLFP